MTSVLNANAAQDVDINDGEESNIPGQLTGMAALGDGGYVITWNQYVSTGGTSGYDKYLYAQRYDATGHKVGNEYQLVSDTTHDKGRESVTSLSTGGFVATWSQIEAANTGFGNQDIYSQVFNADGTAVAPAQVVNYTTDGDQNDPVVQGLAGNRYVVAWYSTGNIYMAVYRDSGSQILAETKVNTDVTGAPIQIAASSDGGFVALWDSSNSGIQAQFYDQYNQPIGAQQILTPSSGVEATAGSLPDGGYVVAWIQYDSTTELTTLYRQTYDETGQVTGAQTAVATSASGHAIDFARITTLADGGYVVVWEDYNQGATDAYAQRYDANGDAVGPALLLNDHFDYEHGFPNVIALADGGFAVAWEGSDGVEERAFTSATSLVGSQLLYGTGDADDLDGGSGNDSMYGGMGDDTYHVNATGDVVYETAGEGWDTVISSVTYTLGDNVEALTLSGTSPINGTGNALDNLITGNSGNNTLIGMEGSDTIYGGAGNDHIDAGSAFEDDTSPDWAYGGDGDDVIVAGFGNLHATGDAGNDTIRGGAGDDILDGGDGNDTLSGGGIDGAGDSLNGGAGNDTFLANGDGYAVDAGGDGIDTLDLSAITTGFDTVTVNLTSGTAYATYGGVSVTFASLDSIEAVTGSALNDTIIGNAGVNILRGGAGNDTIDGGAGDDQLFGGGQSDTASYASATAAVTVSLLLQNQYQDTGSAGMDYLSQFANLTGSKYNDTLTGDNGNNLLDGGAGADVMKGGLGDDTYVVGNSFDNVGERLNEGTDTVLSSITYTLPSNVENLTLTGTDNLNATGNSINNIIHGNAGNNLIDGGAGADQMYGGAGNDTFVVNNSFDKANENANEGTDTVQSSITFTLGANVENLTLTGTTAINGTGNALANIITGNSGNNTLTGGAGNDTFVFGKFGIANGLDHLVDFVTGADHLSFTGADYGIAAGHTLTAGELSLTGVATSAAGVGQFVYNTTTHTLSWDANGVTSGGVTAIVVFDNAATPHAGDFLFT